MIPPTFGCSDATGFKTLVPVVAGVYIYMCVCIVFFLEHG